MTSSLHLALPQDTLSSNHTRFSFSFLGKFQPQGLCTCCSLYGKLFVLANSSELPISRTLLSCISIEAMTFSKMDHLVQICQNVCLNQLPEAVLSELAWGSFHWLVLIIYNFWPPLLHLYRNGVQPSQGEMLSLSIWHHLQIIPRFLFTSSHVPPKVLSGCFVKKNPCPFILGPRKHPNSYVKYCAPVRGKDTRHIMGSGYLKLICAEKTSSMVVLWSEKPCVPAFLAPPQASSPGPSASGQLSSRGLSIRSPNPSSL